MRNSKLVRGHSTKAERKFGELLKELHIKFKAKQMIGGREIDFIIGNYVIEIDGHLQDSSKNTMLRAHGYIPLHLTNEHIGPHLKDWLIKL